MANQPLLTFVECDPSFQSKYGEFRNEIANHQLMFRNKRSIRLEKMFGNKTDEHSWRTTWNFAQMFVPVIRGMMQRVCGLPDYNPGTRSAPAWTRNSTGWTLEPKGQTYIPFSTAIPDPRLFSKAISDQFDRLFVATSVNHVVGDCSVGRAVGDVCRMLFFDRRKCVKFLVIARYKARYIGRNALKERHIECEIVVHLLSFQGNEQCNWVGSEHSGVEQKWQVADQEIMALTSVLAAEE